MNKNYCFLKLVILLWVIGIDGKVLFIVDKEYYDYTDQGVAKGKNSIAQYMLDVKTIDRLNVDTIVFENDLSKTWRENCARLWRVLTDAYGNAINTAPYDTVEGAVLIGNIPVPMFVYGTKDGYSVYPVDYYYMDIWNSTTAQPYNSDLALWKYPAIYAHSTKKTVTSNSRDDTTYDTLPYFNKNLYDTATGDKKVDIWVSRIYAKSIDGLRAPDSAFGKNLENFDIVANYLARVHDRMTKQSTVPPRGFEIGTNNFTGYDSLGAINSLNSYLNIDKMNLGSLNHFVLSDANVFTYQTQLQSGPYGGVTKGSFKGTPHGTAQSVNKTYYRYQGDTRGYEWAGLFEHSGPDGHWFDNNDIPASGMFESGTANCSLWVSTSDLNAYGNSFHFFRNRDKYKTNFTPEAGNYSHALARWTDTINYPDQMGNYRVYLYYPPRNTLDSLAYVNIYRNRRFCYSVAVNQKNHYPDTGTGNWQNITYLKKTNGADSLPYFYPGDIITVELTAACQSPAREHDTTIADAVKLIKDGAADEIILDDQTTNFTTHADFLRTYLSMQDDGGVSKTPFYLLLACHISNFSFYNDLGLLYAMGQKGLISLGASSSDYTYTPQSAFVEAIAKGMRFGASYREYAQSLFTSHLCAAFSLIGAGTLKPKAYIPYADYEILNLNNCTIDNYSELYVKQNVNITGNVNVTNEGTLNVISGKDIIITPDFFADYGSKLDLKVKKSLF